MWVQSGCRLWLCLPTFWRVHLVQACRLSRDSGPAEGWLWSSGRVLPAFCPLSRSSLGASLANMALFRVLRGFLEGFGVLCGFVLLACFAWLVGLLCACGVRRLKGLRRICLSFYPFHSCFYSSLPFFLALSLLLSACPLVLSLMLCLCVFFFPFGLYAKRKGAPCWCVLSSCVACVQSLVQLSKNSLAVYLAFSSSFGWYSQLIQVASEGLPVFTLIFSGIISI